MVVDVYTRKATNHALHGALSAVTCGLWAPVWFGVWAWNAFGPRQAVAPVVVTAPVVYRGPSPVRLSSPQSSPVTWYPPVYGDYGPTDPLPRHSVPDLDITQPLPPELRRPPRPMETDQAGWTLGEEDGRGRIR